MNLKIYKKDLRYKNSGILSGQKDILINYKNKIFNIPVMKEFLNDNDLQEITIISTCVGFKKTFTKIYRK